MVYFKIGRWVDQRLRRWPFPCWNVLSDGTSEMERGNHSLISVWTGEQAKMLNRDERKVGWKAKFSASPRRNTEIQQSLNDTTPLTYRPLTGRTTSTKLPHSPQNHLKPTWACRFGSNRNKQPTCCPCVWMMPAQTILSGFGSMPSNNCIPKPINLFLAAGRSIGCCALNTFWARCCSLRE